MHGEDIPFAYGFWSLVVVNVGLFAFFILSFLAALKKREWRAISGQRGYNDVYHTPGLGECR